MRRHEKESKTEESLVVSKKEAARLLGISLDSVDRLIADGEFSPIRLTSGKKSGRKGLRRSAIEDFLDRRERESL